MTANTENKKQASFGLNIGSSSILLIFVLLCLICFAALAIISAKADSKLSRKVLERTTAYYNACNEAEIALAGIDNTLADVYANSADVNEYFATVGHSKSYVVAISDTQSLHVTIEIVYPKVDGEAFYHITSWQVLSDQDSSTIND